MITIREKRLRHVFRHFDKNAAGSSFNHEVFPHIHSIIHYANSHTPIHTYKQPKNREVRIFHCSEYDHIGNVGIALKSELPEEAIQRETRDGFLIEVGLVKEFKKTQHLCIVVEKKKDRYFLITAYPGNKSESFPHRNQTPEERSQSAAFWDKYVLLKLVDER